MKRELQKGYFALVLESFFWGTTHIAAKIGAQHMPGIFLSGFDSLHPGLSWSAFFC